MCVDLSDAVAEDRLGYSWEFSFSRKVGFGYWERPRIDATVASLRNPIDEIGLQRPTRSTVSFSRAKGSLLDLDSTITSGASHRSHDPRIRSAIFSSLRDTSE
jgi:hypothetical protein